MDLPALTTASTGRRTIAYLIDWILLMVVTWGGAFVLAIGLYISLTEAQADTAAEIIFRGGFIASVALAFLYFVPCWALFGRSLGMALLGIRVVARDAPHLGGVSWGTAAARTLGYCICWLTPGIGFFFGLHDTIAGTDAVTAGRPLTQGYTLATPPTRA